MKILEVGNAGGEGDRKVEKLLNLREGCRERV
jgi:hypothetical protein